MGSVDHQCAKATESPNCVSSKASDTNHYVEPLTFNKTHLEFTSLIMRFTDDVEFFLILKNQKFI